MNDRKSILIVEDDYFTAMEIKYQLEYLNYNVQGISYSGEEALEGLHSSKIDLIMMDIKLQGKLDGIETARKINEQYNIPVIYMTGHPDKETLAKAKNTNPYGYLIKPVNNNNLYTTIELALHKYREDCNIRSLQQFLILQETKFKNYLEECELFLLKLDNKGVVQFINKKGCDVLHYDKDEIIGKNWFDNFVAPDNKKQIQGIFQNYTISKPKSFCNYKVLSRTGRQKNIGWFCNSLINNRKEITGVIMIGIDINEVYYFKELISNTKKNYYKILKDSPVGIYIIDDKGIITFCNPAFKKIFDDKSVVKGKSIFEYMKEEEHKERIRESIKGKKTSYKGICKIRNKKIRIHEQLSPFYNIDNTISGCIGIIDNITQKQLKTKAINGLREEKEMLIRECHHRIKNSLQVIHSLLNMQKHKIKDKDGKKALEDSQNRLRTISLIHEQLYTKCDESNHLNIKDYIEKLVTNLITAYRHTNKRILYEINVKDIELKADIVINIGLILNELITNSLKYAFPDDRKGNIYIDLSIDNDNKYLLKIFDDGIGYDMEEKEDSPSIGMSLVKGLINDRLNGEIITENNKGTKYYITFQP